MKKIIAVLSLTISIILAFTSFSFACTRVADYASSGYVLGSKSYLNPSVRNTSYVSNFPYSPTNTFDILDNYPHYTTEYVLNHFTNGEDFLPGDVIDITWMFNKFKSYLTSSPYYSTIFDSSGFKGVIQLICTNTTKDIIRVYPNYGSDYYDFENRTIGTYKLTNEHTDGYYMDEDTMIQTPYQYHNSESGVYSCLWLSSDDYYFCVACFPGNGYVNSNLGFSLTELNEIFLDSSDVGLTTTSAVISSTTPVAISSDPTGFFTDDGFTALTTVFSHVKQFFNIKWPGTNFSILGIFISVIATIFVINVAHNLAGFGFTIAPSKSGYEIYKSGNTKPSKISDKRKGDEK